MPLPHVLIVDDDERFALLVASRLRDRARCFTSLCGEGALLQFEHHLREKAPFRVVFMDIEMPDMDGHEAVRRMRAIEEANDVDPRASFKLVMLSAHHDVRNVSRSFFREWADAYISKDSLADGGAFLAQLETYDVL